MRTPDGNLEFKNKRQKVLYHLYTGRKTNARLNIATFTQDGVWISGGWTPLFMLRGPFTGGDSAGRRVRELREMGWPIIDKDHEYEHGKTRRMHIYALGVDPRTMDWDWQRILNEWPNYMPAFDLIEDELEIPDLTEVS
ncbi:MAG: hypothetical protein H8E26_14245 [FCB group bacterium]|nr:hypothetical protein [FCB group bacterium]MBL7027445.1 hypothetical protein [Candidatus Neomarinimicrobiota bacterium]MBL7122058.1 hypothetical protein [Candidatus Neomarinimicrobiota bacterium]